MKKKFTIDFLLTESNHVIIECKVNSIKCRLLIDTGASHSCIDYNSASKFNLSLKKSQEKGLSATNNINEIYFSNNNKLEIADLKKNDFEIILFDMTFINNSLREKEINAIDGIIGGDLLIELSGKLCYKKKQLILEF